MGKAFLTNYKDYFFLNLEDRVVSDGELLSLRHSPLRLQLDGNFLS